MCRCVKIALFLINNGVDVADLINVMGHKVHALQLMAVTYQTLSPLQQYRVSQERRSNIINETKCNGVIFLVAG